MSRLQDKMETMQQEIEDMKTRLKDYFDQKKIKDYHN